jgi:hypothetical protein
MKLLIFTVFVQAYAYGFINIESLRKNSGEGLNKSGKILFNQQTGNTDKILGSLSSLNSYLKNEDEFILMLNMRYGESFEQKDTEDGSFHLRYTREIAKKKHFLESYLQYEYNQFKALNSRELFGLGYRFTSKLFNMGIGAFKEQEIIEADENQSAVRANLYLSTTLKNDTGFEFSTILYIQPNLNQGEDTRTILNAGVSQRVTKNLNLIIEFQNVYDQRPPLNIKTYDSSLMFGVNLI